MEREIWRNPKQERTLDEAETPLWFWNDKLEKDELLRQLRLQSDIGVKSTTPHARRNGGEGYIGGYLDQKWFEDIKTVVDYKKEHHEKMWLYDEIDWPAGTCDRTVTRDERNREQYVTIERVEIPAGEKFRAQLLSFEGEVPIGVTQETDQRELAYNVNVIDAETEEAYDLSEYLIYDMFGPELEFISEKDAVAFLTKIQVDAYEYGGDEQANYLDVESTRCFLQSTYETYRQHFAEDFGTTITTVFDDETRMCHPIAWSRDFAKIFREKKGYDIRRELFRVILPGERAGRIRCDYFDVLAYLFQTNYFGEIHRWCEEHGLKLFAHLLGEETLFGHVRYSGDYLRQNRYQDVCGADHLGKGIGSLDCKFAACGAHSYGKDRTAVEIFAGCGWDLTFEEYTRMVTWAFGQGMQMIINHGFFYSDRGKRKDDWPPSQFFQWQGWEKQPAGNDMIRRLHYAMTDGVNEADILVYFPMESFWLHYLPDQRYTHAFFHGPFLQDGEAERIDREVQLFLNGLLSRNMDFDLIHQDAVENFGAKNGKIVNLRNGQQFSVLVLPMCEVLPIEMARLCRDFAKEGGKILAAGELPRLAMAERDDGELGSIVKELQDSGNLIFFAEDEKERIYQRLAEEAPCPIRILAGKGEAENSHPAYPPYLIDPYLHTGEDLDGIQFTRYIKDGRRNTLFMNYGGGPEEIEVFAEGVDFVPEIWDTMTGEVKEAPVVRREQAGYVVRLELPCSYGIFLVSGHGEGAADCGTGSSNRE